MKNGSQLELNLKENDVCKWQDFPMVPASESKLPDMFSKLRVYNPKDRVNLNKKEIQKYAYFYAKGVHLSTSIFEQAEEKLELLVKYFPGQFGQRGREPLNRKADAYIGAKFNYLIGYSKRYAHIQ